MFCEKCGTKNLKNAKFCENCGHKMAEVAEEETKNTESKQEKAESKSIKAIKNSTNKIKELPKKNKIIMASVFVILAVAIIVLCILLNNPVKKVEDNLESYYKNYSANNNKELVEIGEILKSNKENSKVLNNIKDTTHKIMEKWVKNFNTDYKDKEELLNNYNKVSGALKDIYHYYNGLEYMLNSELYNKYYEELQKLNSSKMSYLNGKEYENKNDEYNAYFNYQKVIEEDSYYKEASKFVNEYVKDEISKLKEGAESFIKINDDSTNKEIYDCYVEQLTFLKENKVSNYIDLSSTEEYKKLYETATSKIVEYTKKIVEAQDKDYDYAGAIKTISNSIKLFAYDSDEYKELTELQKQYEDKMPDNLVDKYRVSKTSYAYASSWGKKINNVEYENYISFAFEGESQNITYRLNSEYKKFKTKIVRGEDWDKTFTGYFVITGDGKELYKSSAITKTSELAADIDLDVSGIDDLKIEFVTESKATGWDNFYIYLVEPYLYK